MFALFSSPHSLYPLESNVLPIQKIRILVQNVRSIRLIFPSSKEGPRVTLEIQDSAQGPFAFAVRRKLRLVKMPLFESYTADKDTVASIIADAHSPPLTIESALKSSQNQTFLANDVSGKKYIVRVTPDPSGARRRYTEMEVDFLAYLKSNGMEGMVCGGRVLPVSDRDPNLLVTVFEFAPRGAPVVFPEWDSWMSTEAHVRALGRWTGKLHRLSKKFTAERSLQSGGNVRMWPELHDNTLAPCADGLKDLPTDIEHFGLLHGDINISNYHYDASDGTVCMFDFDQLQLGWYLYDLTSPIWTVITIRDGGNPLDGGSKVPGADAKRYTEWLLAGYEEELNTKVDRKMLDRLISLRRELYVRFCSRALVEVSEDHPMRGFCAFMDGWLSKQHNDGTQSLI
jgi:amicoumacin kinase